MNVAPFPQIWPKTKLSLKNILFATDLSAASAEAQVYAVLLSRFFGAHLHVLHVDDGRSTENGPPEMTIAELNRFFRLSGVQFTLLLEKGEADKVIHETANTYRIDLIVLGSHGRRNASYLFTGSVSEKISRSTTRPVIMVGPKACPGFENSLKTILWATDFSEESKLGLPFATLLAEQFQANLAVFHVAPKTGLLLNEQAGLKAYLLNKLKRLAPNSRFPRCSLNYSVVIGEPAEEIVKAARRSKADLIMMGLHSAVRFTSHLPERLSYRVLCEATCPVLSVLPSTRELKMLEMPARGALGELKPRVCSF